MNLHKRDGIFKTERLPPVWYAFKINKHKKEKKYKHTYKKKTWNKIFKMSSQNWLINFVYLLIPLYSKKVYKHKGYEADKGNEAVIQKY